jgi:2-oxoglutarate ferredoxin oxidoreductase subunit beta
MKANEYKSEVKPIWCPGCGHYSVLNALAKAFSATDLKPEECVLVSGIGCSSRLPAYVHCYGFHGVHGRALPVATGIKVARPELTVIALGGDGDGFSIGGNHFLHACRRNVDLVYLVMDNEVYGMTKGQASPTTPAHWEKSKLTPHGPEIRPFQPCAIALAAGASFIARCHSGDPNDIARVVFEALAHPGFAFIQVLSQCITFCPEQAKWKEMVHNESVETSNPVEAATFLYADDGFSKGIFYRHPREVWPAPHKPVSHGGLRLDLSL